MKNDKLLVSAFMGILFSSPLAFSETSDVKKELLLDLKEEAKKCVVELVKTTRSKKEVVGYESSCATFKIVSLDQAQIFIDGQWYNANIKESELSDDGDLDNLYIANAAGQLVAQKLNVAAYDSVVSAIVGSESGLKQKEQH